MRHRKTIFLTPILLCAVWIMVTAYKPAVTDRAQAFIQVLTPEQKAIAVFPFFKLAPPDWHFFPTSIFRRPGVMLADLNIVQKVRLEELINAYLSNSGYRRVQQIMDLEHILKELEPQNPHRIPENYSVAIYGTPHPDSTWAWTFEGHHLSLHFTVVKDQIAFAPFFFGSNPAEVKEGPRKGTRVIAAEEDVAFEFMNALTPEQTTKAVFQSVAFKEIVTANATQVSPLPAVGIAVAELTQTQKDILWKLLTVYLSSMRTDLAATRLQRLKTEDFDMLHFGWAGAVQKGQPHYYRIQGKTFLIEFDNIQNNANHIHVVWRDFEGDFGRDLLREHYMTSDHH